MDYFTKAKIEDNSDNYEKAYKLSLEGIENGDYNCWYLIARYNLRGLAGLKKNKSKAEKLFKEHFSEFENGAKQGNSSSMLVLYYLYCDGFVTEIDIQKAMFFLERSSELDNSAAQIELGNHYKKGNYFKPDYQKAIYWYKKSANLGNPIAQVMIGRMYYEGLGVKQNYKTAIKWYKQSAKIGNSVGQQHLGYMYNRGKGVKTDYYKAVELYKKASVQNNISAQQSLGYMYYYGLGGLEVDYAKAIELYQKTAKLGLPAAQQCLGYMYYYGKGGLVQNYKKAFNLYEMAAQQGHAPAQQCLGYMYYKGIGVKQNYKKAISYFEKSASKEHRAALHCLGKMYKDGLGVNIDYKKSIDYFLRAIKQDYYESCYELAMMYYDGLGVEVDLQKAKELFEKANNNECKCEYILNIVKNELGETDDEVGMKEYAKEISNKNLTILQLHNQLDEDLKKDFCDTWDKLQNESKSFLKTGLFQYFSLYNLGEEIYKEYDFSSSVTPMVKALENELKRYFYEGYICYLKQNNIEPNKFNEKKVFIKKEDGKLVYRDIHDSDGFSLGTIKYLVGVENKEKIDFSIKELKEKEDFATRHTVNGKNEYTVDTTILDYFEKISKSEQLDSRKELIMYLVDLCNEVTSISDSFRNKSAHTTKITCGMANVCANYLIKVKKMIKNFVDIIDMNEFNEIVNK